MGQPETLLRANEAIKPFCITLFALVAVGGIASLIPTISAAYESIYAKGGTGLPRKAKKTTIKAMCRRYRQ
jgi:hypothetical protein